MKRGLIIALATTGLCLSAAATETKTSQKDIVNEVTRGEKLTRSEFFHLPGKGMSSAEIHYTSSSASVLDPTATVENVNVYIMDQDSNQYTFQYKYGFNENFSMSVEAGYSSVETNTAGGTFDRIEASGMEDLKVGLFAARPFGNTVFVLGANGSFSPGENEPASRTGRGNRFSGRSAVEVFAGLEVQSPESTMGIKGAIGGPLEERSSYPSVYSESAYSEPNESSYYSLQGFYEFSLVPLTRVGVVFGLSNYATYSNYQQEIFNSFDAKIYSNIEVAKATEIVFEASAKNTNAYETSLSSTSFSLGLRRTL